MASKHRELDLLARGVGCFSEAAIDEPLFILRANDPIAPTIVRIWCELAQRFASCEADKIVAAYELAEEMEVWRATRTEPYRMSGE